jgi:hypothetical protein
VKSLSKIQQDAGIRIILVLPLLALVGLIAAGLLGDLLTEGGNQLLNLDAGLTAWWAGATP